MGYVYEVFSTGCDAGQPPAWLEALIQGNEFRPLLFRLADKYRQCLLLRYAVRRIADAGAGASPVNTYLC